MNKMFVGRKRTANVNTINEDIRRAKEKHTDCTTNIPCKSRKHPHKSEEQKALAKSCCSSSWLSLFLIVKNEVHFMMIQRRKQMA